MWCTLPTEMATLKDNNTQTTCSLYVHDSNRRPKHILLRNYVHKNGTENKEADELLKSKTRISQSVLQERKALVELLSDQRPSHGRRPHHLHHPYTSEERGKRSRNLPKHPASNARQTRKTSPQAIHETNSFHQVLKNGTSRHRRGGTVAGYIHRRVRNVRNTGVLYASHDFIFWFLCTSFG